MTIFMYIFKAEVDEEAWIVGLCRLYAFLYTQGLNSSKIEVVSKVSLGRKFDRF